MSKSASSNRPGQGHPMSIGSQAAAEALLDRILNGKLPLDAIDDIENQDAAIGYIFDAALQSLKRTNVMTTEMLEENRRFREGFDRELDQLEAAQRQTRKMIEELIGG
jgi:hypothetical protein